MSETRDSYFGACPVCLNGGEYLNIGRNHWFICAEHRTKWFIGSNLFSCWRDETEEQWRANEALLADFAEVEPVRFPLDAVPQ